MNTTKAQLFEMIDRYESDPNGVDTCDLLCDVLDLLPEQPEGSFTADEVREMVSAVEDG